MLRTKTPRKTTQKKQKQKTNRKVVQTKQKRHCTTRCGTATTINHPPLSTTSAALRAFTTATTAVEAEPVITTTTTTTEPTNTVNKPKLSPAERFQARNAFMRRRHVEKDHLVHTHKDDLRIFAANLTNTLREAVTKHKLTRLEAELWGGYAVGTALYAGSLRGNDRVICEAFLQHPGEEQGNHLYIEAFAVGEIRGFASVQTVKPDQNQVDHPGTGVLRLTKAIYAHRRKYQSTTPAGGDPMKDWQMLYDQSEQVQTYFQPEVHLSEDAEGNVVVDFCGATLIQALGGDATPEKIEHALKQKVFKRGEDETEHEFAKRVQLYEMRNKIVDSDLANTIQQYGATGYVAELVGLNPAELGRPTKFKNIGNINDEFDYELFERTLLSSALREKPLVNVINTQDNSPVTEVELKDGKHIQSMDYRPLQFFCRCFQTPPKDKLIGLPKDLLQSLMQDESVTFTCDFCATDTEITQEMIATALKNKEEMEEQMRQKQQEQIESQHANVIQSNVPETEQKQ